MDVQIELTEFQKNRMRVLQAHLDSLAEDIRQAREIYISLEGEMGEDLHNALDIPFASEQRWLVERFSEDADDRRNLMKFLNPRS